MIFFNQDQDMPESLSEKEMDHHSHCLPKEIKFRAKCPVGEKTHYEGRDIIFKDCCENDKYA